MEAAGVTGACEVPQRGFPLQRLLTFLVCVLAIQGAVTVSHFAALAWMGEPLVAGEEWPVVDVVYTWVNGSDPLHQASLEQMKLQHGMLGACNGSLEECDVDSIATASRFQDNEELRYSLRSIEKFVPWARHIFIVTNGQVPHWLDVEHPRISLVTHADIYANASHLPTFSSPSIESHLHRIPGLAKNFIYFNDDVMIGRPLSRDDFYTDSAGTKVYLSWPVPLCKPGCMTNFLGDGVCDEKCNVTECNYDHGDCFNPTEFRGKRAKSKTVSAKDEKAEFYCATSCPDNWVGDKHCDRSCNVPSCGHDAGDCGLGALAGIPMHILTRDEKRFTVPPNAEAVQLDVKQLAGEGNVLEVYHDNNKLIRTATMAQSYKKLVLTFHRGVERSEALIHMKGEFGPEKSEEELKWMLTHCTSKQCKEEEAERAALETLMEAHQPQCCSAVWWEPEREVEMCPFITKIHIEAAGSDKGSLSEVLDGTEVAAEVVEEGEQEQEQEQAGEQEQELEYDPEPALVQDPLFQDLEQRLQRMGGFPGGRHLLDMFADSLRHTSQTLTQKFGAMERKVPAHMPHMINTDIIEELHELLPMEFEKTSANKLRSADDIQFALSYFYYLIQRPPRFTIEEKFYELDVDADGLLSHNELRTVAVRIFGNNPLDEDLFEDMEKSLRDHSLRSDQAVDLDALLATEGIKQHLEEWYSDHLAAKWEKMGTDEVAFLRINQNDTELQSRLDGIRERQHLFICLNDDIEHDDPRAGDAVALLHEFYQSLVPLPSSFELPPERYHQHSYIHDVKTDLNRSKLARWSTWAGAALVVLVTTWLWCVRRCA